PAEVVAVQPLPLACTAPPHVMGAVHMPQSIVLPQPSETGPQFFCCAAHVVGMQGCAPQTLATPSPPQNLPVGHMPQSTVPPQPSGIEPQFLPSVTHLVGVHAQSFGLPLSPQRS